MIAGLKILLILFRKPGVIARDIVIKIPYKNLPATKKYTFRSTSCRLMKIMHKISIILNDFNVPK